MNPEFLLLVARDLMREAAQLQRWAQHTHTESDREASETRATGAKAKAWAAIKLVSATVEAPS